MTGRITRARWQQILAQAREGDKVEIDGRWVARRVVRRPQDVVAVVTGAGQHGTAWQMDLVGRLQDDVTGAISDSVDASGEKSVRLSLPASRVFVAALGTPSLRVAANRLTAATWPALRDQQQQRVDAGESRWKPCVTVTDGVGRPEVLIDTGSDLPRLITWGSEWDQAFVAPMDAVERLAGLWAQARLEDPDADPLAVLAVHAVDELARADMADKLATGNDEEDG